MEIVQIDFKKTCLFLALLLTNGLSSCTEEYLMDAIEITAEALTREQFFIGDYYQGGIIIALDDSGQHGLIAAIDDQGAANPWWHGEFVETGAVSSTDGEENTKKIIRVQGIKLPYAAKLCADYQYDGYDDWFLPSKDQLNMLFKNRHVLDGISSQFYWTSTEHEIGRAWVQNLITGEQLLKVTGDQAGMHIRAVREF